MTITLWTIQDYDVLDNMQKTGFLYGNPDFVDEDFMEPYRWMIEQMKIKIGNKPSCNSVPLWAWYRWEGKKKRPDLRHVAHLPTGTKGVRIEFLIDDSLILLSDFMNWHCVLNYCYLEETDEEFDDFEKKLEKEGLSCCLEKPLPHAGYHNEIVKSWEKIFNVDLSDTESSIQATFWELPLKNVVDVKEFIAR